MAHIYHPTHVSSTLYLPHHRSDITGRQKWGKYKYPIADGWEWLEDWKIDFGDDTEDQNKDDNREGDDNNDDDGGSEDADDDLASVKSNNTDITDGSYVDAAVSISGASSLDGKECSGDTGSADTDQGVEMKADEDKKISPLTSSASKHAVDAEGWQYSKSHLWGKYHPNKGKMDMARRRRWSRRRMKFDG